MEGEDLEETEDQDEEEEDKIENEDVDDDDGRPKVPFEEAEEVDYDIHKLCT